ncbi:hypothetical protein BAZSYMA_ACONTIG00026_12 [Bathymodiolus azoricus thioautotrophic gill symbiont]|uniref:Uncharacterized protein n=1 Tax=Bathymodiolus azoricus thioautotrophic gill symbiont TaxID=235205 RepID=A0A1H6KCJ8_9GAMM|nr:hypothetical protein BAZSYMA_ACONTIG00026_12 [Bathymodiolus azoricus thioautotrophic gill symbiont]
MDFYPLVFNKSQKKVDADHFFNDKDALLIDEVSTWLK